MDALDLLQLHCPPTALYYRPEVFGYLDDLVKEGKIRHYGVSVERVEEALKAIEYPGSKDRANHLQLFPAAACAPVLSEALKKNVGILARVPLASGMLTGKLRRDSSFAPTITAILTAKVKNLM